MWFLCILEMLAGCVGFSFMRLFYWVQRVSIWYVISVTGMVMDLGKWYEKFGDAFVRFFIIA